MLTSAISSERKGETIPAEAPCPVLVPRVLFAGDGCRVDTNFAGAGRHHCRLGPMGELVIAVDHEPAHSGLINPSPWYGLRIISERAGPRTVVLDYCGSRHRYAPFLSLDGRAWVSVSAASIELNSTGTRATLRLDLPKGGAILAAQPLSTSANSLEWVRGCLKDRGFSEARYGASIEGRPLVGFLGGSADAERMVVALTRQHPPEITGEAAFRGFVDRLSARDDLAARKFRSTHRIVLAPMPNPDGVDAGNWRLNAGGIDLNRDWSAFSQPETRALSTFILSQAKSRRVVSMMDFHSTDRTTVYAPARGPSPAMMGFLPALERHFSLVLPQPPQWVHGHVSSGHSSKRWALEVLKTPGITIELSDDASKADARILGAAAADGLIGYFAP